MSDKWQSRFLDLAEFISTWSKDPSTKVGAVITDSKNRILALGYNGFPRGVEDTENRLSDRNIKYEMVVHAEVNAILNATSSVEGATLYTTFFPCPVCAGIIIQAGIKEIITRSHTGDERYKSRTEISKRLFTEGNVSWLIVL